MSGICGLFNRTGEPVTPELLELMLNAMRCGREDGTGTWLDGPVGLGHVSRPCTPEAVSERQPIVSPSDGLVLTSAARLDNRGQLLHDLGISGQERGTTTDASLILRSFQEWRETSAVRLLGDYSFAIWWARERRLLVTRGCDATTGLYYHLTPGLFAFASSVKALLAVPLIPKRLNEVRIAQVLTAWQGDGQETAYLDIRRFPLAHTMAVCANGVELKRFWQPGGRPELRLRSDDEYVEALLEVYSEAVRCRLRNVRPVGVALSGGLDSSSIAALASAELAMKGQRLPALTSVPIFGADSYRWKNMYSDERGRVELIARHLGNVDTHWVTAEGMSPLAGLSLALDLNGQPEHAGSNAYWILSMLEMARQQGLGALLSGQFGNAALSWQGAALDSIQSLARNHRWWRLARELRHWTGQRRGWRSTLRPFLPASLLAANRLVWHSRQPANGEWLEYSFISPDFATRIRVAERMAEDGHDPTFRHSRGAMRQWLARSMAVVSCVFQGMASWSGVDLWDPTSDRRVLDYCMAVPDEQWHSLGLDRWLARRAVARLLPSEIAFSRMRGLQASDLGSRLRQCRAELVHILDRLDSSPVAQACLDLARMRHRAFAFFDGVPDEDENEGLTHLLRALQVGMFLAQFSEDDKGETWQTTR